MRTIYALIVACMLSLIWLGFAFVPRHRIHEDSIGRIRIGMDQPQVEAILATPDAKDAQFQTGASYAELENWPTSAERRGISVSPYPPP